MRTYTEKDMSVLRETDETRIQASKKNGIIKDYSLNHRIKIMWDLNEDSIKDRMFKLQIDDIEVICDTEEFMRYLRWV